MCFAEIVAWQPPDAGSRPVPIGSRFIGVSLQPAIPRRVAPQQSPLPLHQSPRILAQSQSGEAIKCALNFRKDAAHAVARRWVAAPALAVSAANPSVISTLRGGCHFYLAPTVVCKRNIEMTPLCKIEVTHPRVLGSREVRRGGVVDEQAGVQPS
jgi:hypothetical protein